MESLCTNFLLSLSILVLQCLHDIKDFLGIQFALELSDYDDMLWEARICC